MIGENPTNGASGGPQRPRKPPSEIENRIFELLKSIPVPRISEQHCRAYANRLNAVAVMAQMHGQRPEAQRVGAKRTQTELERLSDLAEKMTQAMNCAHLESNNLIRAALPKGVSLSQYKRTMNGVFRVLHQADVDAAEFSARGKKPTNRFAEKVACAAEKVFIGLTGRDWTPIVKQVPAGYNGSKATTSSPFIDFLERLFAILGIDASAEYHARQLRRNRT
jgi:hypothetical protein